MPLLLFRCVRRGGGRLGRRVEDGGEAARDLWDGGDEEEVDDEGPEGGEADDRAVQRRERFLRVLEGLEEGAREPRLQVGVLGLVPSEDAADDEGGEVAEAPVVVGRALAEALADDAGEDGGEELVEVPLELVRDGER